MLAATASACLRRSKPAALREKDNIAYIIDSHGIAHDTFTIVYRAALKEKN